VLAREDLGFVYPDEIIVMSDKAGPAF